MKNKVTFRQILKKVEQANAECLIAKAITANRLAKVVKGKSKHNAYHVKAETLLFLVKKMPKFVRVREDKYLESFCLVEFKHTQKALHLPKALME